MSEALDVAEKDVLKSEYASAYIQSVISKFRSLLMAKNAFPQGETDRIVAAVRESLQSTGKVDREIVRKSLIANGFSADYAILLSRALT